MQPEHAHTPVRADPGGKTCSSMLHHGEKHSQVIVLKLPLAFPFGSFERLCTHALQVLLRWSSVAIGRLAQMIHSSYVHSVRLAEETQVNTKEILLSVYTVAALRKRGSMVHFSGRGRAGTL